MDLRPGGTVVCMIQTATMNTNSTVDLVGVAGGEVTRSSTGTEDLVS